MRKSPFLGRIGLTVVSLSPVIRRAFMQDSSVLTGYEQITYTIGIVSGLISYTMLALTFVLAGRFRRIENLFGGLDKMYIVHAIVGSGAFVLMLMHPIFLVLKYIPVQISLAAAYLLPGAHRSINFGIAGFLTIILLMILTLYIKKIKYHHRKNSHTFFSIAFLFVAVHVFLIKSSLATIYFPGYYTYATIIALLGIGTYLWTIRGRRSNKHKVFEYQISAVKSHGTATELALTPVDKKIAYTAGQFAFLRFESEQISSEPHPFSFASSSKSRETVRVIMKHGGDFTDTLPRLHIGDRVRLEGPYGKFTLDTRSGLKNIRIAGGIGITPFMAMADELVATPGSHTAVDLYYLVRTPDDLIGLPYFQEIADTYPSFRVVPRVSTTQGRLDLKQIEKMSGNLNKCDYYLCGPTGMKDSFITLLREKGVPQRHLHSEGYSFKI